MNGALLAGKARGGNRDWECEFESSRAYGWGVMNGAVSPGVEDNIEWPYSLEWTGALPGLVDSARESPVPVRRSEVVSEEVVRERWWCLEPFCCFPE